MSRYVFRFIGGKYEGGELALLPQGEMIIGRAQEAEICLVEDMVSRRHASLHVGAEGLVLTDLQSTNGTFVNGERIQKCELEPGDRVLVGTSILRLIDLTQAAAHPGALAEAPVTRVLGPHAPADDRGPTPSAEPPRAGAHVDEAMGGELADVPVGELLQLLAANARTGVVRIDGPGQARLLLREGRLLDVQRLDVPQMSAPKALARALRWDTGAFAFTASDGPTDARADVLEGQMDALLIEASRHNDEAARLRPQVGERLQPTRPMRGELAALTPEQLQALQRIWDRPFVDDALDVDPAPDAQLLEQLQGLIHAGVLEPAP